MWKMNKRFAILLVCVLMLTMLLPVMAFAVEDTESTQSPTLTFTWRDEETPLIGANFQLYLVAESDKNGNLTPTEDFAALLPLVTDDGDQRNMAATLEGYVLAAEMTPDASGFTNEYGQLTLPEGSKALTHGLYLVRGQSHIQDGKLYSTDPFMVEMPGKDSQTGEAAYDLHVVPKCTVTSLTDETDTMTLKVLVIWEDEGYEHLRPETVTVDLLGTTPTSSTGIAALAEGDVTKTVALSADVNWRHTWEELPVGLHWSITEDVPERYTVTIKREGITFVIINKYIEDEEPTEPTNPTDPTDPTGPTNPTTPTDPTKPSTKPILPQTGQLWWPVPLLIVVGMFFIAIGLLRRRGPKDE